MRETQSAADRRARALAALSTLSDLIRMAARVKPSSSAVYHARRSLRDAARSPPPRRIDLTSENAERHGRAAQIDFQQQSVAPRNAGDVQLGAQEPNQLSGANGTIQSREQEQ